MGILAINVKVFCKPKEAWTALYVSLLNIQEVDMHSRVISKSKSYLIEEKLPYPKHGFH